MVRVAVVVLASLVTGLLGQCGPRHRQPDRPGGRLDFTWAGGFAARHQRLVIEADGTATLTEGMPDRATRRVRLDAAKANEARSALDYAGFTSIPSDAGPTGAADAFEYTIVYRGHRVFRDESNLPRELGRPVELLRRLVDEASRSG